eukprot:COSAG02_NODE_25945_length_645_cov_0.663004_1_plen_33_part_01
MGVGPVACKAFRRNPPWHRRISRRHAVSQRNWD